MCYQIQGAEGGGGGRTGQVTVSSDTALMVPADGLMTHMLWSCQGKGIIFPKAPENNIGVILNFFQKILGDIHKSTCTTSINKLAANLPLVSTTPAANLLLVSTTQAENLPPESTTPVVNIAPVLLVSLITLANLPPVSTISDTGGK